MARKIDYHLPEFPHWHKPHIGELRSPISVVVFIVIILQLTLPKSLSLSIQPYICAAEFLLAALLFGLNPGRISRHRKETWATGIALTSVMMLSNVASVIELIAALINGTVKDAVSLLAFGGSIWLTNVVVFGLWYWEFDRGGPGARAEALDPYPDFLFPQMSDPIYAPENWTPKFFDYLYVSFTNASAFSPTDVLPLSRWAKHLMMIQSVTSLITVGLVIARAVNILK